MGASTYSGNPGCESQLSNIVFIVMDTDRAHKIYLFMMCRVRCKEPISGPMKVSETQRLNSEHIYIHTQYTYGMYCLSCGRTMSSSTWDFKATGCGCGMLGGQPTVPGR